MKKPMTIRTIAKNVSAHARPAPKPMAIKRVLAAATKKRK
jgi:hypothetical protein